MRDLSFLRIPTAKAETVLLFILIVIALILAFIFAGLVREFLRKKRLKESFFKEAFEKELTEEEAQILWEYSIKLGRDPFLALEFKAPFEKVVDLYLKESPNPNEELIKDMRMKLGFDYVPYFVPIVSTKDIDLFQPGKLYLPDGKKYEVALFDKDERFMYWAVIDRITPAENLLGKKITISFIRKGDGIYKFEGEVLKTFTENGKLVIQIPHTFELSRFQRREYARVEVEIPTTITLKEREREERFTGEIVDISAGGAKVCIPLSELERELPPTEQLTLNFSLEGKSFNLKATIVNIYPRRHAICYGVKFENISPEEQKFIHDFVRKEQKKMAELALKNRG
ncbi:flagellar brake protein [Thermovibrio sp.]